MTTNGNNNGTDRIDLLMDQMARLTELVTTGFTELKTIAQSQHQDINRLVGVVDKLADTTAQQQQDINRLVEVTDRQANTVDKLAETTAQQAKMLEQLLSSRVQNN
jgi:ABC-type transporter Mla subunit MlaD